MSWLGDDGFGFLARHGAAPVLVVDDGVVRFANDATTDVFGYDPDALVGAPLERILPAQPSNEPVRAALDDGETRDCSCVGTRADGAELSLSVACYDPDADGTALVVTDHEVDSAHELPELLDACADGVALLDASGTVVDANEPFADLHGHESPANITGESWSAFVVESDDPPGSERLLDTVEEEGAWRGWLTGREHGGGTFDASVSLSALDSGRLLCVARDVSKRAARQRELEQTNEQLDRVAGFISHDLREPLMAARARAELAQQECDNEYLDRIHDAHDRIERIIDDVLTLARQGDVAGETEPVDISDAAEDAWELLSDDGVFDITDSRTVSADPERLQTLFQNLLNNALEHGGDDVTIRVGTLSETDGFFVADDGPGIPEAERETVFEHGYTTAADGNGFGLHIVEQIAEAHGWDLAVAESESGGARFEIRTGDSSS